MVPRVEVVNNASFTEAVPRRRRPVLDVRALSDHDRALIAAEHGVMPHTHSWSDTYVPTNDGALGEKGRRIDLRSCRVHHHQVAPIEALHDDLSGGEPHDLDGSALHLEDNTSAVAMAHLIAGHKVIAHVKHDRHGRRTWRE